MDKINKIDIIFIGNDYENVLDSIINKEKYRICKIDIDTFNNLSDLYIKEIILICNNYIINNIDFIKKNELQKIIIYEDLFEILNNYYRVVYYKNYDYNYLKSRLDLFSSNKYLDILTVGLSYSLFGIDQTDKKYNNLSLPSQDLYYSYKICKYMIDKNVKFKYCIIGLSYYSFHFDLSKATNQTYLIDNIYGPILNDFHNYIPLNKIDYSDIFNEVELNIKNKYEDLIDIKNTTRYFFDKLSEYYFNDMIHRENCVLSQINSPILTESERYKIGYERSNAHNKTLNYTKTLDESLDIMDEFLYLLNINNITPVIVVFPVSKYYREYADIKSKNTFYDVINLFKNKYKFELLDMFSNEQFDVEDFIDSDHMSEKGSIKATNMINSFLDNLNN